MWDRKQQILCFESIKSYSWISVWVEKELIRFQNRFPYRKVLEEPRSHNICGHFREDASFLLPLLVLIILVSSAWWCQAVVEAVSLRSETTGVTLRESIHLALLPSSPIRKIVPWKGRQRKIAFLCGTAPQGFSSHLCLTPWPLDNEEEFGVWKLNKSKSY